MGNQTPAVELVIRNVRVDGFNGLVDLAIDSGKIHAIGAHLAIWGVSEFDGKGHFVSPPFIDPHTHLDKAFLQPEPNSSGSLNEAIKIMGRHKDKIAESEFEPRVDRGIRYAIKHGTLAIRTHIDVDSFTKVETISRILNVKRRWDGIIDLQIVAFPQEGLLRDPESAHFMRLAMEMGADVVGGIPAIESSTEAMEKHIDIAFELAKDFDADIDMHIDENLDSSSRTLEMLAEATMKAGWEDRVAAAHCCSLSVYDDKYAHYVIGKVREAGIHIITNPSSNLVLLGRDHGHPKPRGITRVKELIEAGVNVSCGQDNLRDVFYPFGQADMLEAAFITVLGAQMTGFEELQHAFNMPRYAAAKILKIKDYGIQIGNPADLVLFPASSPADALATRPPRSQVYRGGKLLYECNIEEGGELALAQ